MANTSGTRKDQDKNIGQTAENVQDKAREAASTAAEKAREVGGSVMEKAREAASSVARTAGGVAATAGEKADDATASLGSGIQSLGGTLRERGPKEGMLGQASSTVAGALENTGRYLEEQGLSGITDDLTNLIRRNPIPAVLMGIGVGYLIGRVLRR